MTQMVIDKPHTPTRSLFLYTSTISSLYSKHTINFLLFLFASALPEACMSDTPKTKIACRYVISEKEWRQTTSKVKSEG